MECEPLEYDDLQPAEPERVPEGPLPPGGVPAQRHGSRPPALTHRLQRHQATQQTR